jgi:hypothetical protein
MARRMLGARATLHACDATDGEALAATLAQIRATMPALRGVVQAAAVFADGAAARLDPTRVAQVLAAKLTAAEHLDRLTARDPLALVAGGRTLEMGADDPGRHALIQLPRRQGPRGARDRPAGALAQGLVKSNVDNFRPTA